MDMLQGRGGGGSKLRVRRDPGWPPGAPQIALGGGPEAPKNNVAPPGDLLGWKVDRFQLPGGGPGAPRSLPESLPESILEASFLGTPPGTTKV